MLETQKDTHLFLSRQFGRSYRVIKSLNGRYLAELGYDDFKIGHCMAMLNLEDEGITAVEIAKKVNVSKQAMSKLIQELININEQIFFYPKMKSFYKNEITFSGINPPKFSNKSGLTPIFEKIQNENN